MIPMLSSTRSALATTPDDSIKEISRVLQNNLNSRSPKPFKTFFTHHDASELNALYKKFLNRFPNAKWTINNTGKLKDGNSSVAIKVIGISNKKNYLYELESNQKLSLEIKNNKIIDKEIISSYSILKSGNKDMSITISIPNSVLTGTRYDFDVIFDNPSKDGILAGGLANLTKEQIKNQNNPNIELFPLGGGGLFKSVQAPLSPGEQHWAALLAHPDGLIAITKLVKIVSNEEELIP